MEVAGLDVSLEARASLRLPVYPGAMLRGAFGNAFRRIACPFPRRSCPECLLGAQCVYRLVFESPRPVASRIMRKYETIPRPFVIEPEPGGRELTAGDRLGFHLLLLGPAINWLPYFILAFEEMAQRGLGPGRRQFSLVGIEQHGKPVYDVTAKALLAPVRSETLGLDPVGPPVEEIALRFLTPVRIVYDGRVAQSLDFHVLFRALVRRIGLLSYFYSEQEFEIDYRGLIVQAERVKTRASRLELFSWRRYSTRQEQAIDMDGLVGEATYESDFTPFMPFLRLGEILHVGKGTVFGLGKYRMELEMRNADCGMEENTRKRGVRNGRKEAGESARRP